MRNTQSAVSSLRRRHRKIIAPLPPPPPSPPSPQQQQRQRRNHQAHVITLCGAVETATSLKRLKRRSPGEARHDPFDFAAGVSLKSKQFSWLAPAPILVAATEYSVRAATFAGRPTVTLVAGRLAFDAACNRRATAATAAAAAASAERPIVVGTLSAGSPSLRFERPAKRSTRPTALKVKPEEIIPVQLTL